MTFTWFGVTASEPAVWAVGIGAPPYDGMLSFSSGFRTLSSAIITNNTSELFDLVALDLEQLELNTLATTNIARMISSAGGVYNFTSSGVGKTISLQGSEWQNLDSIIIEYQLYGGGNSPGIGTGLTLDNIVLRPHTVPEPASWQFLTLTGFMALGFRRRVTGVSIQPEWLVLCPGRVLDAGRNSH